MRAALLAALLPGLLLAACSSFVAGEIEPADASAPDDAAADVGSDSADDSPVIVPDAGIDAMDADASPACPGAAACERVVFVTSGMFAVTDINGVAGATGLCNQAAAAATAGGRVKGRHFRAWLSSAGQPAASLLVHGSKPYVLANGTPVASDWPGFIAAAHLAAISVDETGAPSKMTDQRVWTGTMDDGTAASDCTAWTGNAGQGTYGRTVANSSWSQEGITPCSDILHLYCVEQ